MMDDVMQLRYFENLRVALVISLLRAAYTFLFIYFINFDFGGSF